MSEVPRVTCCIAGGGPAGAVLSLLLARAGVDVLLLEKHADFLRDFRGDTIHASTLQLLDELGLAEAFLNLPHQTASTLQAATDDGTFTFADFRRLPGRYQYIAFMPQWDFLDFIIQQARELPTFRLEMQTEAVGLLEEGGRVVGVTARGPDGVERSIRAALTVAADGRRSTLRASAGLRPRSFGAPMDVLWFRLSRNDSDHAEAFGRLSTGRMLILIDRGDYWQVAYVIPKGSYDTLRQRGLPAFRDDLGRLAPFVADRVTELSTWDDISMLDVQVDRLRRWYRPGLLCIGDAAHAMSPIAGVGINLAIQDAVAAANRLAPRLHAGGTPSTRERARVQLRRTLPTVLTQRLQRTIQDAFLSPLLAGADVSARPPRALRLMRRVPALQGLPARLVGIGILLEHIRPTLRADVQSPAPRGQTRRRGNVGGGH